MFKFNKKGFFLIEALVVTTIVTLSMVFLYTQMTKIMSGYELRLEYNTVDGLYSTTEINKYLIEDDVYSTITSSPLITSAGFVGLSCSSFSNATFCNSLFDELKISKIIVATKNTAALKAAALTEATFSDDLKLFINNIKNESSAGTNEFRVVVEFSDGSFATMPIVTDSDTEPPVISGEQNLVIFNPENHPHTYAKVGLTALDSKDGDVTDRIVCVPTVEPTYNCTATDLNGNTSTTFTRILMVVPPVSNYTTQVEHLLVAGMDGYYQLEAWGAQGGSSSVTNAVGGNGGYAVGTVYLTAGTQLRVLVGGQGIRAGSSSTTTYDGGHNGGGTARGNSTTSYRPGTGGGATDFRLGGTALSNRILVAGGGGGSGSRYTGRFGGAGGGYVGIAGSLGTSGTGGTQIARGTLATGTDESIGGNALTIGRGGGGGGYFGGGASGTNYYGGGGGSSYANTTLLFNTNTIAGNATMPDPLSTGTIDGKTSHGYARITFLGR